MKKIFLIIIILFSFNSFPQTVKEFRAVKLTNVDSGVLFTDQNIAQAMDYLSSIGVNVVLPVVWNGSYTEYRSALMDSLFGTPINPQFTGRDPLARVIIEAHRVGIEVYPWFEYGFAAYYSGGTPPFGGHILQKYPDWALRTSDGSICTKNGFDWMSAINPEVQKFVSGLVKEVINNYDVDGIEFSDRIPAMPVEGGYDSVTASIYKSEHNGAPPPADFRDAGWMRWRADKLNEWFRSVRDFVKKKNPNLFVSSSPSIYPWSYDEYLQDAETWVKDGIADHFIPQLYRYNLTDYLSELNNAVKLVGTENIHKLFSGILMNIGTGSGAYVMSPDYLLKALKANRDNGVMGEAFFYYEGLRKNNNLLGDTLKATFYNEAAIVPGRTGEWRPKALIVNEDDSGVVLSGNWQIYKMKGFTGEILRTGDTSGFASISYNFNIRFSGYYDVYSYRTPNTPWTKQADYTLFSDSGQASVKVDQSDLAKSGWWKLGTLYLSPGNKTVLKLDNDLLEPGRYLTADAAMVMLNRSLSQGTVSAVKNEAEDAGLNPAGFELYQNYPNPFNPSTVISYRLPANCFVTLEVYDLLGSKIAVLLTENQTAGIHNVVFNSRKTLSGKYLSSGIYFYKITAGNFSESKKLILLK